MSDEEPLGGQIGERKERKHDVALTEKRARALRLRTAGASYQVIADSLGFSGRGAAHKCACLGGTESDPDR
jgi:hypothetical protein